MANLGPQRINLSYDGLLQVPNGITATLQTVTDGNGNNTGLQISTTGFGGQITSDGAVITGGTINGTTIGATSAAAGHFTTLSATGTTTLASSLSGILKGTSGVVGLASAGTDYVSPAVLGAANGVATLGADSKLTASQVPAIAVTEYLGAVASQAAMLALTGQAGDWCTRTDLGTNWVITGSNPSVLADWTQLSYPTAPVTSVNGLTGAVSLSYTNVGAAPATTGSSILYANGSGGFSNVTVGSGLSFVGGTLTSGAAGTVTSASVVTANGFAGTVANASSTPAITLTTTVSGLLKGNGTAISAAVADTDYQSAITATGILKGAGAGSISAATSGTDYAPGTAALATGILKSTTSTGALSIAVVGTDYAPATTGTSILKGNGTGGFSSAASGTDYAPATSGTSILKGNGSGGFSNATSGTDYAPATSGSDILYGNGSGGFSNVTVGSGLSFVGGTLASTSGGGSVTTVSVVTANGFAGTVANASSTPAITLTTSVTGLLKGNGTAISAATSGTDYAPATSGTAILKGNGAGGFSSAAAGSDYLAPPSGTSILKANSGGALANAVAGTDYPGISTANTFTANQTVSGNLTASALIPSSSTVPTNGLFLPTTNALGFATNSTERLRLDASGNLGLGVTPSAWLASSKAFQFGSTGSLFNYSAANRLGENVYYNTSGTPTYLANGYAEVYLQNGGAHTWYTAPSGTAGNAISFTQAMTLDASGNLGVGGVSASGIRLLVTGGNTHLRNAAGGTTRLIMGPSSNSVEYGGLIFDDTDGSIAYGTIANYAAKFITNNVERARIDTSGNFLVGTTSAGDGKVRISASANAYNLLKIDDTGTTGGNYVQFLNSSGTQAGAINHNGTTTVSYTSASDQRLKENVVDAPSALGSVNAIKVRSFDWKSDGSHVDYGYIAQELLEIVPEAVSIPADPEEMMGVDFGKLTPRLVKAIQELSAQVFDLKTELNELKQKVNA